MICFKESLSYVAYVFCDSAVPNGAIPWYLTVDRGKFPLEIIHFAAHFQEAQVVNIVSVNREKCDKLDCNNDLEYGMHEDYWYYKNCDKRYRNKGLYTADQVTRIPARWAQVRKQVIQLLKLGRSTYIHLA